MNVSPKPIWLILVVGFTLASYGFAAPQTPQATSCQGLQPIECRKKAAGLLRNSFGKSFPNMQISAVDDTIVFADPYFFKKEENQKGTHIIVEEKLGEGLCKVGFRKMRFETLVGQNSVVDTIEYPLSCQESPAMEQEVQVESGKSQMDGEQFVRLSVTSEPDLPPEI